MTLKAEVSKYQEDLVRSVQELVQIKSVHEQPLPGKPFGDGVDKALGYVLSTLVYAVYCVWQFVFTYGQVDFRYLLLFVQYLPMSLALTWCYDNGGSIWSAIALHMVLNAVSLASTLPH